MPKNMHKKEVGTANATPTTPPASSTVREASTGGEENTTTPGAACQGVGNEKIYVPEKLGWTEKSMNFRETSPLLQGITIVDIWSGRIETCIEARFYGRAAVKCAVWVYGTHARNGCGVGRAGGYGYHKASAALCNALDDMGIRLGRFRCTGCGDTAMEDALLEIARECGAANPQVVKFHA